MRTSVLKNSTNHKLINLLYNNRLVVLFIVMYSLLFTYINLNILACIILGATIIALAIIFDTIIRDKHFSVLFLSSTGLILFFLSLVFFPKQLPDNLINSQNNYCGTVINIAEKYSDIKLTKTTYSSIKVRVYHSSDLQHGDNVTFKGVLQEAVSATNPGQFSYKNYLYQKGISYICYSPIISEVSGKTNIKKTLYKLRQNIIKYSYKYLNEDALYVYSSMVFGDKTIGNKDISTLYQETGLSHILAMSGLHLAIIAGFISFITIKLRVERKMTIYITLGCVWFYVLLCGSSISLIRSAAMISVYMCSKLLYKNYNSINTLALIAIVLLTTRPYLTQNVSFMLSFFATFGVLAIYPILKLNSDNKFLTAIKIMLAIQLVTLPILINIFHYIPTYSLMANIVIAPFVPILMGLGLLSSIPLINNFTYPILSFFIKIKLHLIVLFSKLPVTKISVKNMPVYLVILYFLVLILTIIFISLQRKRTSLMLFILLLLIPLSNSVYNVPLLRVAYLDVEQGDGAVVQWPDGYTMVIDGGEKSEFRDYGESVVVPYLRYQGVNIVDALVVSHSDIDHIGGLLAVAKEITVKNLYISQSAYYSGGAASKELISYCRNKGISINIVDNNFQCNDFLQRNIRVFGDNLSTLDKDSNDKSIVIKIQYGLNSMLFTGDIEKSSEDVFAKTNGNELCSDILKVPHHGSLTSSTNPFIDLVSPKVAIFSAGRSNKFNHPNPKVVNRYISKGVKIYRTDKHGAIMLSSDGVNFKIKTYLRYE